MPRENSTMRSGWSSNKVDDDNHWGALLSRRAENRKNTITMVGTKSVLVRSRTCVAETRCTFTHTHTQILITLCGCVLIKTSNKSFHAAYSPFLAVRFRLVIRVILVDYFCVLFPHAVALCDGAAK